MKKALLSLAFLTFNFSFLTLSAQTINTFAGKGVPFFWGDGGPATAAGIYYPYGVAVDAAGNTYIADTYNSRIRMVNTSGIITTIAGNGINGNSGDGGPATAAEIDQPNSVAVDALGNFYTTDENHFCVRMVNTSGIITTLAGNGTGGYSGDGGPATAAELDGPNGVAADASGNIYICDDLNHRIRMVNTSGIISTFAGNGTAGFSGDGGPATTAELRGPQGVSADASGNIYVDDFQNSCIRKVNNSGIISTIAGMGGIGGFYGDGGPATAAELAQPTGTTTDPSGNLYIADLNNNRIRMVNTSGIITTFAGNGTAGFSGDGGPATAAEISSPWAVAADAAGNIYITDQNNNRIRIVSAVATAVTPLLPAAQNNSFVLYPNPVVDDNITLSYNLASNARVKFTITDCLGREVLMINKQAQAGPNEEMINVSSLAGGVYFINCCINGEMQNAVKFVK